MKSVFVVRLTVNVLLIAPGLGGIVNSVAALIAKLLPAPFVFKVFVIF